MFFIMGMSQGQKQLDFHQMVICRACGQYGRYEVFVTYMYLSFFFIPLFKWNKQYYVKTSCCGSIYSLDPAKGKAIEHGQDVSIEEEDIILHSQAQSTYGSAKHCANCGYEAESDFEYCPKCGRKLG